MWSNNEVKVDIGPTEERLEEPLSPSAVVYVRTHAAHILVTIGLGCPTNVDTFRAQLPLALNHPRFSSLLVGDVEKNEKLKWVQASHMNIDDHIVVPTINPTTIKNRLLGDKFVEDYLHNLTNTSLDTSKPLWEFHLLDVKTSEAESIWIFRTHHALGDGISITSHVLAWTRQLSNPNSLPTIATIKKKKREENIKIGKHGFWRFPISIILAVWWYLQLLWNTIVDISKFSATMVFLKDSDVLVMPNLKSASKRRRIVYKTVSLDDIKFIKNAMNVTINDVAMGIIEAGFSRCLSRRFGNGNKKEDMKSNDIILEKIRLRIAMAVNLRPLERIQGLDDLKSKDTKLGLANEIGFVVIPISFRLRHDPLEYVRKAKVILDRKKHSLEAKLNIDLCKIAAKVIGYKLIGLLTKRIFNRLSICVSNVPGPVEETSFFNHPVKFVAPTIYGMPSSIQICFQSCTNRMAIVVATRENVIFDPHELLDDIIESLLLIKDAIMKGE